MTELRIAAVSVDLDEVHEYVKIHDLRPIAGAGSHAVYDVALRRIEAWATRWALPITFFAVGRDLDRAENASALRRLSAMGHAVESHSLSHRYDLTRLSPAEIETEVRQGLDAVERAVGIRPEGFRAPGYTVCDPLFDALDRAGVRFDSSVLPSPVYYAAKAAVLGWMHLRGRGSASILDTPRVVLSPRGPYVPGEFWGRPARGGPRRRFVELPILVTPLVRFPVIGTSVGRVGGRMLARVCRREPFVNFELHGMDFLEAADLGAHPLRAAQPELRAPLGIRLERLRTFVSELLASGFTFVTLREAARRIQALPV